MRHRSKSDKGSMGLAVIGVLAAALILHLIFPTLTLWPSVLVALVAVTMIVSHATRRRKPAPSNSSPQ